MRRLPIPHARQHFPHPLASTTHWDLQISSQDMNKAVVYTLLYTWPEMDSMIVQFCSGATSRPCVFRKQLLRPLRSAMASGLKIKVENGTLVLRPIVKPGRKPRYTLDELLDGMTRRTMFHRKPIGGLARQRGVVWWSPTAPIRATLSGWIFSKRSPTSRPDDGPRWCFHYLPSTN